MNGTQCKNDFDLEIQSQGQFCGTTFFTLYFHQIEFIFPPCAYSRVSRACVCLDLPSTAVFRFHYREEDFSDLHLSDIYMVTNERSREFRVFHGRGRRDSSREFSWNASTAIVAIGCSLPAILSSLHARHSCVQLTLE